MRALKIIFIILFAVLFGYLLLPNFNFPKPPPDSIQSKEKADTETPLRRAYFTNYTRGQVLAWYESQFRQSDFLKAPLPVYRLNYPPEDAQTLIRDQTRSTFLEEIVHPLRESIYVNGFEPKAAKDAINIEGRPWRQKIIVRFVPSLAAVRIIVLAGIIFSSILLFGSYMNIISEIKNGNKTNGEN